MGTRKSLTIAGVATLLLGAAAGILPVNAASASSDPNAPAGQCADSAMVVRVVPVPDGGGAGQDASYVEIENVGRSSCALRGAPGVSFVGHGNGTQIGHAAGRPTANGSATIHLSPGQSYRTELTFTVIGAQGSPYGSRCHVEKVDGYRIYPPHSFRSQFVPAPQYACANTSITTMQIITVGAEAVGCAQSTSGVPAGANRRSIADVDGDLVRDTEWYSSTRFGITTASGATSSVPRPQGDYPQAMSVVLRGTTTAISLLAAGQTVSVYRYTGCHLRTVTGRHGAPYRFDRSGQYGVGVGCQDYDGNGKDQLIGFMVTPDIADLADGQTATITATPIGLHGTAAITGRNRTFTTSLPTGATRLRNVSRVSCRGATLTHNGITPSA